MKDPTSTALQRICIDEDEVTELAAADAALATDYLGARREGGEV